VEAIHDLLGPEDRLISLESFPNMGALFQKAAQRFPEAESGLNRRLLVILHGQEEQKHDLTPLLEAGIGLDIISVHPAVDWGPLERLCALLGGEFFSVGPCSVAELARRRLRGLLQGSLVQPHVSLRLSQNLNPLRFYCLSPKPLFLGDLAGEQNLSFDPGVLQDQKEWILSLRPAPRREGRYRLLEIELSWWEQGAKQWRGEVLQEVISDPFAQGWIRSDLNAELLRVEACAWVEELAVSRDEGDGRHIVLSLDRLIRYLVTEERAETQELVELRLHFLRTGFFDNRSLNRLRQIVRGLDFRSCS